MQSFASFDRDVKANNLPQYAHMSPDMLNDGHNTTLEYAADWTQTFLEPLLANEQFMNNTLILLTYDESATYPIPNRIVSLLLGGAVPQNLKGTKDSTLYTHYSIISTLQNNWDLPSLGRYDAGANVFDLVASQTGYVNHAPENIASINNSLSYPGFLNAGEKLLLPPPNLQLTSAGGKGVDEAIKATWASRAGEMTPYDGSGIVYDGGNGTASPNAPVYKAQGPAPDVTVTPTATGPTATANLKSRASAGTRLDISWAGMGFVAFAVAAFVL